MKSFSPSSGLPTNRILITGNNLFFLTGISFNGTPATLIAVDSPAQVEADVPDGATTGPITVTTKTGSATSAKPFAVNTPPVPLITKVTPSSAFPGSSVILKGTGFTGTTAITFNGTPALTGGNGWDINSDKQITVTVPDGATTGPLVVTTPAGIGTSSFTVTPFPVPHITSVTPGGSLVGYQLVTIKGTGFIRVSGVKFNGVAATIFNVLNAGQIIATVPDGATTGPISVTGAGGTGTSATWYAILSDGHFASCLGGSSNVPAGTVPYLQITFPVFGAAEGKALVGSTLTTLTINGVVVKSAGRYWSKTPVPANPYELMYWTYIPGVLLPNPGSTLNVTFDVVVTRQFDDGIEVHPPGQHLFPGPACSIIAA